MFTGVVQKFGVKYLQDVEKTHTPSSPPPEHSMPYNLAIHNRQSIRLPGYDFSRAGAYYLTTLTHKKEHLFGKVVSVVKLSPVGEVVQEKWQKIPRLFSNVALDAFVIMPNHMHGILVITEGEVGEGKGKAFEKRGTQKVHST